jgi:aminoglycoside 6'-N-acetyltransferase
MTDDRGSVPILLETERLMVRRFHAGDVDAIHAYRNDEHVARHQGWETPWERDDAVMLVAEMALRDPLFERGEWAQLAIERKDAPGLVGDIGVLWQADDDVAEIGFTLDRSAWGNGFMTEALSAVVGEIAQELGLRLVAAVTMLENTRARSVLEMVGFAPVALDGDDEVVYAWKPQGWSGSVGHGRAATP